MYGRMMLAAAMMCATPGVASATKIVGSYEGVISSGSATGGFGYAGATNLAGQAISGTFAYDTDDFGTVCSLNGWSACYLGSGLTITQTVNGVTETFVSTLPAVPEHLNHAQGGLAFYTLTYEGVEVAAYGFLGAAGARSRNYWTSIAPILSDSGGIDDVQDRYATYSGASSSGYESQLQSLGFGAANTTRILELTAGDLTMNVEFAYDIRRFTIGPVAAGVPEPATWALMLVGFGLAGATLRSRGARTDLPI